MLPARLFDKLFMLNLTLKQVGYFKATPIQPSKSDSERKSAKLCNLHGTELRNLKIRNIFLFFATICQLIQCIHSTRQRSAEHSHKLDLLLGWFCYLSLHLCSTYALIFQNKGPSLKYYLENLFLLRNQQQNGKGSANKFSLRQMPLIEISNTIRVPSLLIAALVFPPCFVLAFHFRNICKPSLIGYFLVPECHGSATLFQSLPKILLGYFLKVFVLVTNIWLWHFAVHVCILVYVAVHVTTTMLTRGYIVFARRSLRKNPTNLAFTLMYRNLQALNNLGNNIQQDLLSNYILKN